MSRQNKSQLPDWYPLPIYGQELTKDEWLTEIGLRAALQAVEENVAAGAVERTSRNEPTDVFRALFVTRESRAGHLAQAKTHSFWPVREVTPFEAYFIAECTRLPEYAEAEAWAKKLASEPKRHVGQFFISNMNDAMSSMPRDVGREPGATAYQDVLGRRIPIIVDLDHDDDTLSIAFKVWLAGARQCLENRTAQPIGAKEFAKWKQFGLLPAFDLLFWRQATAALLTDTAIANAIWPPDIRESVDITERFRKVTRPLVREVFGWSFVSRFWRQMEFEKSLDLLMMPRPGK